MTEYTTVEKKVITAADAIHRNGGRVFSATFIKKDGSVRKMNCRTGVAKYISGKGNGMSYDPKARGLQPVYDLQAEAYRMINLRSLIELKLQGKKITFAAGD